MINASKIIYSINTEDVQNVAMEELGRELNKKELKIIEDKIGDYIDWYESINLVIDQYFENNETRAKCNEKNDEGD